MPDFTTRLKMIMEEKDITQAELSRKTGIRQSSLSGYMNGTYEAKQDKIGIIACALDVPPSYLMGWDDIELTEDELSKTREKLLAIIEETNRDDLSWSEIKDGDPNTIAFRRFEVSTPCENMFLGGYPITLRIEGREAQTSIEIRNSRLHHEMTALRKAVIAQIGRRPLTIAAHALGDLTDEQIGEVMNFIDYLKSKKKKK